MAETRLRPARPVVFDFAVEMRSRCPNCGSKGMLGFYAIDDIPVHSCLLMSTRQEALSYPRGDLNLGFCSTCGFVSNLTFDPGVHEYSGNYEETQGFSRCFNSFAESLAKRLIDQYDIRHKDVLEIGCGKGEFLMLLSRLAGNRCIGIDPAYVPERMPVEAGEQVTFIRDFYSDKYSHLTADFICCRHTLEHIAPTRDFLVTLRSAIGDRRDTMVFFEVPDVLRVLREGAFWDIYYEHCSYFSPGSLARLFRGAGFDVVELTTDFEDQYLLLMARPADGLTMPVFPIEDDLQEIGKAVIDFEDVCATRIDNWRACLRDVAAKGDRAVVWGSGSKGVAFLSTLGFANVIEYVVDVNPHRHGKFMPGTGQQIVSPLFLTDYQPQHVIVMNPIYCPEIRRDLDRLGVKAGLLPV